jgi:outer membrane protein assembly factor BamB
LKIKNTLYMTLILLITSFATVQTAVAQIPCGPTPVPSPSLVVNWPQFHFDAAHSGCNPYESILSPDTVGNLVLKWQYTTGGAVESPPAVANGVVYVGSDDDYLYALNASTGALIWKYYAHYSAEYAPAVANGVVYAFTAGAVVALNANTGALIWQEHTTGGYGSGITVLNGTLYVACGRNAYALDAGTGNLIWQSQDIGVVDNSQPAVANGKVYVGSEDGGLYALNASTGAVLWVAPLGQVNSSPAVANDMVFVSAGPVFALNADTGTIIWSYSILGIYCGNFRACGPSVANGLVYALDGGAGFYALNANTGGVVFDDLLYGGSSPAIANGVAYIGDGGGGINAVNASTGAFLWQYQTTFAVVSSPAVANGMMYVGSNDGHLYAFHLPGH